MDAQLLGAISAIELASRDTDDGNLQAACQGFISIDDPVTIQENGTKTV